MPARLTCPDVQALQEYLLGQMPDDKAIGLEEHVSACSPCALKLNDLVERDSLAKSVPRRASSCVNAGPEVEALIGRLCDRADEVGQAAGVPVAEVLGDFRILREIGRGGMGVVYVAEQISLGRKVALKVLPFAAALDQKQLQRFKNEAQAAAQLHHTNIVPVHYVGCERGVHFYAMQFIEGQSCAAILDELRQLAGRQGEVQQATLSRAAQDMVCGRSPPAPAALGAGLPTLPIQGTAENGTVVATPPSALTLSPQSFPSRAYFRTVARLGMQAALALEHAHQMGVVHRDIKPANLLVDLHANLWITDFGLAHCQASAGLTMTGDLLGTLRYMSPEQALGKRAVVDHRTDLYSLGITLYELLTLEAALNGRDREELLRQIAFEEPRPPRRLNKSIPADLETIVLKAMEKNPAERYASAQELADDLERYLKDEPIRARRSTWMQRSRKWSRRHQGAVITAAVALVVSVVALTAGVVLLWQEKNRTQAANDRLQGNLRLALQTLDETYLKVAEARLPRDPQRQKEDQELLKKGLDFYQQFARENSTDRAVRRETAKAYSRVGVIQAKLGHHAAAEEAYGQAATLFQNLAAEFPSIPEYRRDLAGNQNWLGDLLRKQATRFQEAEKAHRQALTLYRELADEFPGVPNYRVNVGNTHTLIGTLLQSTQPQEAEKAFHEAIAVLGKMVDEVPNDPVCALALIQSYINLGALLFQDAGRPQEAEEAWRKALALYESAAARFPTLAPDYRRAVATTYTNLGARLATSGRLREAELVLRRALPVREKLVNEFPAVLDFKLDLGETLGNLGHLLGYVEGDPAEARNLLNRAIEHEQALVNANPEHPSYRQRLRNHYWVLAETMWRLHEHGDSAQAAEALPRIYPNGPEEYERAANFLLHCAPLAEKDARLPQTERKNLAQAYVHRAMKLLQEAERRSVAASGASNVPDRSAQTLYDAACSYAMAAALARADVKQAERFAAHAVELLRQAIAKGFKDVAQMKKDEELDALRGRDDYQKLLAELQKNLNEAEMTKQEPGEKSKVRK